MSPAATNLRGALCALLGERGVRSGPDDLAYYGADRCRGGWPIAPQLIALPASTAEVQATVRLCAEHGAAVVPSGGRTGLVGGAAAVAGEVVLSMERMGKVLAVDGLGRTLRCQAGATVEQVAQAAADAGLMYPVDFAAKGSAQIGGTIATNAGGVRVLRYGSTRAWVLGLEVVLGDGAVLRTGGPLIKDNTGYDLRGLFIGSEGTLGVVTEATLRLCTPPAGAVTALCACPDLDRVVELFARLAGGGGTLAAFECFDHGCMEHVMAYRGRSGRGPVETPGDWYALCEVEVPWPGEAAHRLTTERLTDLLGVAAEDGVVLDAALAATPAQARALWAWREEISESLHGFGPHKSDVTVPIAQLAAFARGWTRDVAAAMPGCQARIFGHVGDGNLHLNLLPDPAMAREVFLARCHELDRTTYGRVRDVGGSVSAEHGIGLLKREFLGYSRSEGEIAAMHALKRALDPSARMNPGKLLPPQAPGRGESPSPGTAP